MRSGITAFLCFLGIFLSVISASAQGPDNYNNSAYRHKASFQRGARSVGEPAYAYHVEKYDCTWKLDPRYFYIEGEVSIHARPSILQMDSILIDLSNELAVHSLTINGLSTPFFHRNGGRLIVKPTIKPKDGKVFRIEIHYSGAPVSQFGSVIKDTSAQGEPVIWSLSEPYGAMDWWPCKNYLSDKADTLRATIITPARFTGISNGVLIKEEVTDSLRTCTYQTTYPIASYLVAFAVADYARFTLYYKYSDKDSMPLPHAAYKNDSARWRKDAEASLAKILSVFEDKFGPYPFRNEIYGQTQFTYRGGMEHQTNSWNVSLDFGLMAHELAHQWWGDALTNESFKDLWLHEGFATYSEAIASEFLSFNPHEPYYWRKYNLPLAIQLERGSVYARDTTSFATLFNRTLRYDKAAYVVQMLRYQLGDSAFFRACRDYLTDPALRYGFVRTENLKQKMEAAGKMDLTNFFKEYVYGSGYPEFYFKWFQTPGRVVISYEQKTTDASQTPRFHIPIELLVVSRDGKKSQKVILPANQPDGIIEVNLDFEAGALYADSNLHVLGRMHVERLKDPAPSELLAFPNPAKNFVSFILPEAWQQDRQGRIEFYSISGQLALALPIGAGAGRVEPNISGLAAGLYIVSLRQPGLSLTSKIVVVP